MARKKTALKPAEPASPLAGRSNSVDATVADYKIVIEHCNS